jgi:two-component system response regulator
MSLGAAVQAGWVLDRAVLKSIVPGAFTMKVNTALRFLLVGLSLTAGPPGAEATFYFTLEPEPPHGRGSQDHPAGGSNADGEAMTLRALKMNRIDNEIVMTRGGAAVVEHLHGEDDAGRRSASLSQAVLLGLKLPKLDGLQVLERIRAHPSTRPLPVVIFTSSDEESDLAHSYDLGANSYARRPVAFAEFTDAVRRLGMHWMLIKKTPLGACKVHESRPWPPHCAC